MGEWDDISGAAISASGPKLNPGHSYTLEVAAHKFAKLFHGETFIVEMVVHESDDVLLPPGTRPSWTANKKHAATKGNILCHVGALFGIDPANETALRAGVNGQHVEYLLSAAQPGRGRFIRATTSEITTKADQEFTVVKFHPYLGQPLASRLNDAPVAAGVAPSAPQAPAPAPVSMPGGFQLPQGFAPPAGPSLPMPGMGMPAGFPNNGLPVPAGLMGLSTVPPVGGPPPIPGMGGPPALPPPIPTWPPAGWTPHPAGLTTHLFKGQQVVTVEQLRAMVAAGQA